LDLTSLSAAPAAGSNSVNVVLGLAGAANGTLFDLGRAPRFVAYAVRSGRLTACDFLTQNCTSSAPDNWTEVADNIVSLRAEYAVDTSATRDVTADSYSQSPPAGSSCGSVGNWSRVIGVRLVLVARGRQPESPSATAPTVAAPTWAGSASTPIALTGSGWRRYRYKTFETTVPLRNVPGPAEVSFLPC
jgi:type IV pilus assembly protein PilW